MATIEKYKKKDGTKLWRFNTYLGVDPVTGKQKRTTRSGFKTQKAAKFALDRLKVDIHENGFKQQQEYTYREVYDIWLKSYQETVKESTLQRVKRLFALHILPAFGNLKIVKIDVLYCQQVSDKVSKKLAGAAKVMNYAGLVFKFAARLGYIPFNPISRVVLPKAKPSANKDANFYDRDQLQQFFTYLNATNNDRAKMFFRILFYTGMRKGELIVLTWDDIDFVNDTITINKTLARGLENRLLVQTPKTISGNRVLDMDAETMSQLKRWQLQQRTFMLSIGINANSKGQLVFPSANNSFTSPTKPREWMQQIYKKHPDLKQITCHGARHTHASLLFEAGASIKQVQERLGDSDVKVLLNVYTHVSKHAKEETIAKFSNYVNIG